MDDGRIAEEGIVRCGIERSEGSHGFLSHEPSKKRKMIESGRSQL